MPRSTARNSQGRPDKSFARLGGTGRRTRGFNCEIVAKLPEALVGNVRQPRDFCNLQTPFLTQIKGLTTYALPWLGVQLSGTFQSKPTVGANAPSVASESLAANWVAANSLIAPSLGRSLAGSAANATVNIVKPGTLYGARLNQFDVRLQRFSATSGHGRISRLMFTMSSIRARSRAIGRASAPRG